VSSSEELLRPAAADPLALFGVLAGEAPGLATADDVAEVRRAVAAMRRGRRLAGRRSLPRLGSAAAWRQAAAVGVLAAGLLSLAAAGWQRAAESAGEPAAAVPAAVAMPGYAAPGGDEWARRPVFEGLDRPRSASVYELAGEELDVVMVVDETLDV
jgi:hypothetical protein